MSNSVLLAIPEISAGQSNKHITHNNAISFLEAAANDIHEETSAGTGPVAINASQATRHFIFRVSGGSANFDVTFPSQIDANNTKRVFAVDNADTTYTATIKASTGAGESVAVAPGKRAIVYQEYEDIYLLALQDATAVVPYDIGCYVPGLPSDGGTVMKFSAVRAIDFADDFAGSRGHCEVNPTSTAVFSIEKNGSAIGSISINTSGVFTFATTGGATALAAGDRLSIIAPSPQDATLADVNINLAGTRAL